MKLPLHNVLNKRGKYLLKVYTRYAEIVNSVLGVLAAPCMQFFGLGIQAFSYAHP